MSCLKEKHERRSEKGGTGVEKDRAAGERGATKAAA